MGRSGRSALSSSELTWKTTRRGLRLMHGPHTVSEVLSKPGPTHSVFDVLGACAALLCRGPQLAILGFAAGGLLAPLRALGCDAVVTGVDLSLEGYRAFRRISGAWAGDCTVVRGDAGDFLRDRRRFDLIVEDLSVQIPGDVTKPSVSLTTLPKRIAASLKVGGAAVFNLLPVEGLSMSQLRERVLEPFAGKPACEVRFTEFENRVLVVGGAVPPASTFGRALRTRLKGLRSRQATRIRVGAAEN